MENGNIVASRLLLLLLGDSQSTSSYTRSIKTEEMGRVQSGWLCGCAWCGCTVLYGCTVYGRTPHRDRAPHRRTAQLQRYRQLSC
jgi:hypothetical protein